MQLDGTHVGVEKPRVLEFFCFRTFSRDSPFIPQPSTTTLDTLLQTSHYSPTPCFVLSNIDITTIKMARQATQSHKHKHKAETAAHPDSEAQRKSAKFSKSHRHSSKAAAQDLPKQSEGIKKPSKSKKTVSAAGIFKRSKHNDKKHSKCKARTPTPEPDLKSRLRGTISIYHVDSIANKLKMVSKELAPRLTRRFTPPSTPCTTTSSPSYQYPESAIWHSSSLSPQPPACSARLWAKNKSRRRSHVMGSA